MVTENSNGGIQSTLPSRNQEPPQLTLSLDCLTSLRNERLETSLLPMLAALNTSKEPSRPLSDAIDDFLISNRRVLLILGDTGSGKTISCLHLEHKLWSNYREGDRIPLYIDLSSIRTPGRLIQSHLDNFDHLNDSIRLLYKHRFVLICDGYDRRRSSLNLYEHNNLSSRNDKLIITCRKAFLPKGYDNYFLPKKSDPYSDISQRDLYQEETIALLTKDDIQTFIGNYIRDITSPKESCEKRFFPIYFEYCKSTAFSEPKEEKLCLSMNDYWNALSAIPGLLELAKNPLLLELAFMLSSQIVDSWINFNKSRLTTNNEEEDSVFKSLLDDGFQKRVRIFLKRLAEAMNLHQKHHLSVSYTKFHDSKTWKEESFGNTIELGFLREASPLTKEGNKHRFMFDALFGYFLGLKIFDPFDKDDDDDDDDGGGGDDGSDSPSNTGGNPPSQYNSANSMDDGNGPTSNNGGSNCYNGNSNGSNGHSSGGNTGSANDSEGTNSSMAESAGNGSDFGNRNGSGDGDDPNRDRDDSHRHIYPSRSGNGGHNSNTKDQFSDRNYLDDLEVLEFLVERAQINSRMRECLFSAIEKAKVSSIPSLAAANAITILCSAKVQIDDVYLSGYYIPSDYILDEAKEFLDSEVVTILHRLVASNNQSAVSIWDSKTSDINSIQIMPATTLDLGYNSTLTTFNLMSNLIGDSGTQALSEALKINSTLTTLNLKWNPIGDSGAQALSEALKINSTLTTLSLESNKIGESGTQALSEALKINSTLTTLSLERNPIGDSGAQALSEALKINSTLTTLNLEWNLIGDSRAQALSEALKINSTLTA
ncbi:hypothetical protein FBU30_003438 [Linnemannia zychae]|nr:hypothetical protein FBU30_003438 [Linnemannia zychae]